MLQFTEQTLPVFNHSKVGQGFAAGDNTYHTYSYSVYYDAVRS